MTLLVTGATGFLGHHVLRALGQQLPQTPIVVLARRLSTWQAAPQSLEFPNVRVVEGALSDAPGLLQKLAVMGLDKRQVSGIFHLAASVHHSRRDGEQLFESNVRGTDGVVALTEALQARLVFVSTSGTVACHLQPGLAVDEHAPHCDSTVARWPYYASKIACERLIAGAVGEGRIQAVVLRPPVMLGPLDHRFRATSLTVKFLRRRLPFVLSGGMHFIDIRDAAHSMVRAMVAPHPRPVYHLAGHASSLQSFFQDLSAVSGVPAPRFCLPSALAQGLSRLTLGKLFDPVVIEMGQHHWDMASMYGHEIGFAPRAKDLTLGDTVGWLRSHHRKLGDAAVRRGPQA